MIINMIIITGNIDNNIRKKENKQKKIQKKNLKIPSLKWFNNN